MGSESGMTLPQVMLATRLGITGRAGKALPGAVVPGAGVRRAPCCCCALRSLLLTTCHLNFIIEMY